MSVCKGVVKPECLPPNCLWANGQTRKYCRSKHNKAKTARAMPSPPSPSLSELSSSREKTPRARHDLARTPRARSPTPRARSPTPRARTPTPRARSPKAKKAKSPKVKGVEKWKVDKVDIWFPKEDEDNESVFNIESVIIKGPKQQEVVYNFKDVTYTLNEDQDDHPLESHKLNTILGKETVLQLDSFKVNVQTDDLGSIHDETYGLIQRGVIKVTSSKKNIKEHLQIILQRMMV
jgi:hypothetical protein